jgi:hypothetical protein
MAYFKFDRKPANAIPVTNRTPQGLTYGGSGQVITRKRIMAPGGTPLQFMQPSPKDYQDFAFGLLPANADGQAFATPDSNKWIKRCYTRFFESYYCLIF